MDKIYTLNEKQEILFENFKKIPRGKENQIIEKIVKFIRLQHKKSGLSFAVIGLSGGIDSAIVATLLKIALGKENVIVVKMPYEGISSKDSLTDANIVIKFLDIPSENVFEIPITEIVDSTIESLKKAGFKDEISQTNKGNIMARARMIVLYAMANIGGLVADTCNETEISIGYSTKFGDGASDYNPVGKIYKTWIWELSKYLEIPKKIIQKIPSAEFILGQSDEEDLRISYSALDLMLYFLNKKGASKEDLIERYFYPEEIVEMVFMKIEKNRHKNELSPICKIDL